MSFSQVQGVGKVNAFVAHDVLLLVKLPFHSLQLLSREDRSRAFVAACDVGDARDASRVDVLGRSLRRCRRRCRRMSVVFGKTSERTLGRWNF